MAPKNTRKGGRKASKDGDKHESTGIVKAKAEADIGGDVETETGAHAQHDVDDGSDSKRKRRRTLTKKASVDGGDAGDNTGGGAAATAVAVPAAVAVATYKSVISSLAIANRSNVVKEENYYLLQWLYRIRRASCARGLLIGFFRPDFLWSIYRHMMRSTKLWRTDGDIKVAVNLWCFDRAEAEERYGHISDWNVSSVTDMSGLFQDTSNSSYSSFSPQEMFNDDISRWDVSSVTNMKVMFWSARLFNQPIGVWDVSNVTNMYCMFGYAQSFNQHIGDWDVSSVTTMYCMFGYARVFNQDLTKWDMRFVRNTGVMFENALAMQRGNKPHSLR